MNIRGWLSWLLALTVIAVGCASRGRLHYASLHPVNRRISYQPAVEWFILPNGLTVVLAPDDRANLVSVDVRYLVGAAEDPADRSGLAHLAEHLMFTLRDEAGGATLADRLAGAALSFNANTDWDATHYVALALAGNLDRLLSVEATRMAVGCRGIDLPTFERERAVVIQETLQRGPFDLDEAVRRVAFGASHPYARSIAGHDVARITLGDVCNFVDAYYAPGRAILVVGGRIDPDGVSASVTRQFGAIRRQAVGVRTEIQAIALAGGSSEVSGDDDTATAMAGPRRAAIARGAAQLLKDNTSRNYSARDTDVLNWVRQRGAHLSSQVADHTTFTVQGSSLFGDWHLWRLYWRLQDGMYRDARVAQHRDDAVWITEHHDETRGWRHALREALFGRDHPYTQDDGTIASGADVRPDELSEFRDTYYRVNGATLLIVGKFDVAAMRQTVTELFGDWNDTPAPPSQPIPAMQPTAGPTWIAHADPKASQVRITCAFATTSPRASSRAARAIVAEIVRSRLGEVRTRLGASYGITVGYDLTDAGDVLVIDGRVDPDRAGQILRSIQADLDGVRTGDDSLVADFVRARRAVLERALADPVKSATATDRLEAAVVNHLGLDEAAALPDAVAATTLAQARVVIGEDLQPARMVVLLSGQPTDTTAAFASANVPNVRTVTEPPAP